MHEMNLAYCIECEDLVEFETKRKVLKEVYKGDLVQFEFNVGCCKVCGGEVATDIDYNSRRSNAKIEAYKKLKGIISNEEISEILEKYSVGKEALSDIAGFGKVTIKRYFEGYIPAKEYSDILKKYLINEQCFYIAFDRNKNKLKESTRSKISERCKRLSEISKSKIDQVANYIIAHMEEVTPLALEKLLAFSNGVNYAMNGNALLDEECQAWQHGYVYPDIYNKYKKYKYNPIDNGIRSTHGCMLSKVSESEVKAIDIVIKTFGVYSPKTLELISHLQTPWIEKRVGYGDDAPCSEAVDQKSIKKYFIENRLNSEENIMSYIMNILKCN